MDATELGNGEAAVICGALLIGNIHCVCVIPEINRAAVICGALLIGNYDIGYGLIGGFCGRSYLWRLIDWKPSAIISKASITTKAAVICGALLIGNSLGYLDRFPRELKAAVICGALLIGNAAGRDKRLLGIDSRSYLWRLID